MKVKKRKMHASLARSTLINYWQPKHVFSILQEQKHSLLLSKIRIQITNQKVLSRALKKVKRKIKNSKIRRRQKLTSPQTKV